MSLETIYEAVLTGNAKAAAAETQTALDEGISAPDILHKACIPAMTEVGRLFEIGEKFVPEMLIAARAMQAALTILKPLLVDAGAETLGKVVIGTVAGDQHDIGKNLVGSMLEGAGFGIIDLGTDVTPQAFVEAVKASGATIVAMSSLLTTTMPAMKGVLEELDKNGLRGKVRVMVGGAPLTQKVADELGADGYGSNANSAVKVARDFTGA